VRFWPYWRGMASASSTMNSSNTRPAIRRGPSICGGHARNWERCSSSSGRCFQRVAIYCRKRIVRNLRRQNFALVSAIGASVDSSFFYARVKGELERDVRKIGFRSLPILRPSIIEGERDEVRLAENLVLKISHFVAPVLPKRFHVNPAPKIAQVLVDSVVTAEPGCHFRYSDSLV